MADNKKKKVSVPLPKDSYLNTEKNISSILLQKMDPDIQLRVVLSAISLDLNWLVKIFAVACEEMYVRSILKDLPNHNLNKQKQLLNDLKSFGYIINKNLK